MKVLVVGAGFSGSVAAQQFASAGHDVLVIDKRNHIAGNAHDCYDEHGILIHKYGPHIFHTNSERVFEYLSQFTDWFPYEHHGLTYVKGQHLPVPINLVTINKLYGWDLDSGGMKAFLEKVREPHLKINTSEDFLLHYIGRELMDLFFTGYITKQWAVPPSALAASVAARHPFKFDDDCRFFTDRFQFMPKNGYTKMFEAMLRHPRISVRTGVSFARSMESRFDLTVYTGALDDYFEHSLGKLPYRSLEFRHEYYDKEWYQSAGTVVFPHIRIPYTRISEHKRFTGQIRKGTSILIEYPSNEGEPYYPIPHNDNENLYKKYVKAAESCGRLLPIGRLAQYKYFDMDQVVASALKKVENYL